MKTMIALGAAALFATQGWAAEPAAPAPPAPAAAAADAPWPEASFEIFKLAPGKQEAFIRDIERFDQIAAAGGQPPMQMFIHEDGADWDVLLYKPERGDKPTPAQEAAMEAKRKQLNMPTGVAYFLHVREMVASHTDTKTYGPISAAQWIAKLEGWRAANPEAMRGQ